MAGLASWLSRPALLRALVSHLRLAARLVREPRVPATLKALLALPALYVVSPVDFVPDLALGLGQLDDLGIVLLALQAFVRVCPSAAVAFHRGAIAQGRRFSPMSPSDGEVIDAEWRRG